MGLWQWFADPLVKIMQGEEVKDDETTILTPAPVTKQFRPISFDTYIGQERAKRVLKSYIEGVKKRSRIFPHIIISGNAGCGKTALARIIAKELNVSFVETITSEIADFLDIEMKLEETRGGILFLDEIHSIPRGTAESIYTVMEDFTHDGIPIAQFTLIGATTELGEILKTRKPFYDRFKIPIELDDYAPEELAKIAKQYKDNTFLQDEISNEMYSIIGKNCRKTPRIAIRLLESTIYLNGNVKQTLENFGIIKDGFTQKDLRVLKYIALNQKGVGLQALSSFLGIPTEDYLYQIEPYILQDGLILRSTRGRTITEQGLAKIKELQYAKP